MFNFVFGFLWFWSEGVGVRGVGLRHDFSGKGGGDGVMFGWMDGWIVMGHDEALSGSPYWKVLCEGHSEIGDLILG